MSKKSHNQQSTANQLTRWLIFLGISAVLALILLVAAPRIMHRSLFSVADGASTGTLAVGVTDVPDTLDIRTVNNASLDRVLIGNVYETLLGRNSDNGITAGLASSWKTSDDGLTLTFTLRSGLRFANGHTLDAASVVWSLQQAVSNKWPGADTKLAALASVTNPNATTVVITLKQPDATLPRTLSGRLGIVYDSAANIDYTNQAMGSGPYRITDFTPSQKIAFAAVSGSTAKTHTVTVRNYSSDSNLLKAARSRPCDSLRPRIRG